MEFISSCGITDNTSSSECTYKKSQNKCTIFYLNLIKFRLHLPAAFSAAQCTTITLCVFRCYAVTYLGQVSGGEAPLHITAIHGSLQSYWLFCLQLYPEHTLDAEWHRAKGSSSRLLLSLGWLLLTLTQELLYFWDLVSLLHRERWKRSLPKTEIFFWGLA